MMFPCDDELLTLEAIYCVDRQGGIRDVGKLAMSCEHQGKEEAVLGFCGTGDPWNWWGDRDRVEESLLCRAVEVKARFATLAAKIVMALYDESQLAPVCAVTLHLVIVPHGAQAGLCLPGSGLVAGYAADSSEYVRSVWVNLAASRVVSWSAAKPDAELSSRLLPFLDRVAPLLRTLPNSDESPASLPGLAP
jgi:hypothetical protein